MGSTKGGKGAMGRAQELEDRIARDLRAASIEFEREPAIGGLRPDFLVRGPGGQLVVVEAKAWSGRGGNTARALNQVKHYEEVTRADAAFLVLEGMERSHPKEGVVGPAQLIAALRGFFKQEKSLQKKKQVMQPSSEKTVFAAMPFTREYDDTYFVAMAHAAEKVGAVCRRVDNTEFAGDVVDRIKEMIQDSVATIIDLSDSKPNVLYEAGYSHALDKPSVHICSTPLEELPFDVRNWNTIRYERGRTMQLRGPLTRRLKAVL